MKRTKNQYLIFVLLICSVLLSTSCEKYLNEPSDKSLAIITSLEDLQALLDHSSMSTGTTAHMASADNHYLTDDVWESLIDYDRRMYVWAEDNVFNLGTSGNDWSALYTRIYRANTVLEHLDVIKQSLDNSSKWSDIKGQALVFRAVSFLDAAQIWSVAYDAETAETDVGIPLKMSTDFNEATIRANVQETYNQIIFDLKESIPLLPTTPVANVRPSKAAAYGLLARVYLWMRNYSEAKMYADSCLMLRSELMDYRQVDSNNNFPFMRNNTEVILDRGASTRMLLQSSARIPTDLYNSYDESDLRKSLFFRQQSDGLILFRGSYMGAQQNFTGVSTDEIYLTRAESFAREGNIESAVQDLNVVLETRWRQDEFIPVPVSSPNEVLNVILEERRKQLLFRGLRWMDIKRLNKEEKNIELTRTVKGDVYTLSPNSPRFALPLPDDLLNYIP